MPRIQARQLAKSYGDVAVLQGVDLEIEPGEYVVLVGPSGCGKSTLLRCIAGLETITGGDLSFDGRRMNDVAPKDRDVAMVFQSYALYPHMTVAQNLGFALTLRGVPASEIQAAVDRVAAMLELGPLLNRRPAELSGGQRQRVAMGRALARDPSVLLLDEPLSNLDPALRAHVRAELKRLHRQLGATFVHVTHDPIEALTLADRIVVLHQGQIQQVATPRALYEAPANLFVARFLGTPPMNVVPATTAGGQTVLRGTSLAVGVDVPSSFQIGIRPTDLVLDPDGWPAMVDLIEPLGHEAIVHLRVGDHALQWLLPEPVGFETGAAVRVRPRTLHIFDGQGKRL
ncbi:MAG: sn-glycerol-3-phosphate transporter ATP-binding protein UgpC [Pseudomonadota bacterium]|jgi:multiple sugar transport system ATP-binding protein